MNVKFLNKIAQGKTYNIEGFEYKFISARDDSGRDLFHFEWIPKQIPQSYVLQKLKGDCQGILINLQKYFGEIKVPDPNRIRVTVDGKDLKEVYIRNSKMDEILNQINSDDSTSQFSVAGGFTGRLRWWWRNPSYSFTEPSLYFRLEGELVSMKKYGVEAKVLIDYNDATYYLTERLYDEVLNENFDDIISISLNDELGFNKTDYYINTNFTINTLLGRKTNPNEGIGLNLKFSEVFGYEA